MRRAWREAEEIGVDSIFCRDHFFPLTGESYGKHFEAIATLGALAQVTERAQIAALVMCNSYRNPELLADAHRTIDHISFGTAPDRLRDLRAALPRITERTGRLNPPPLLGRLPILIGGSGPKVTLRLVARYGDMWHSFGDAETFKRKNDILLEHCAAVGRDPAEIERTWGVRGDVMDHADSVADAGVQHLILGVGGDGSGYDLSLLRERVAWRDARNA